MRFREVLAIGVLSVGIISSPALTTLARAEDAPKEQPKGEGHHQDRAQRLEHYHETVLKLNLTSDQKTKIDAAFADAKTKVDAAVKDANGDRDALRGKIGPIMKDLGATIHSTLTSEQNEELKKLRDAHRKSQPASADKTDKPADAK